jgi:hypothetical protein
VHLDARIGFNQSGLLVLGCLTRGEGSLEAKRKLVRVFSACVISSAIQSNAVGDLVRSMKFLLVGCS